MTREQIRLEAKKRATKCIEYACGIKVGNPDFVTEQFVDFADMILKSQWHKASEEMPQMKHFTADGDYSDLCICFNASDEQKILVLCSDAECLYWAYGYDGEGIYDEDVEGEITHWMEIPELPQEE